MTESINSAERAEPEHWPDVRQSLIESLDSGDYERGIRVLLGYYKGISAAALDDEPSDVLKEKLTESYGYAPRIALENARLANANANALIHHRQIAKALAGVIAGVLTKMGDPRAEDFLGEERDLDFLLGDKVREQHPHVRNIVSFGPALNSMIETD